MKEQRLGILGGMGPQATQVFYQRILDRTDAAADQEHLPTLILSDTAMPDRTSAILGGDAEQCYRRLLADARELQGCGCTAIAIPCNTSHYFVDRLQGELDIPIVNMVREATGAMCLAGRRRSRRGDDRRSGVFRPGENRYLCGVRLHPSKRHLAGFGRLAGRLRAVRFLQRPGVYQAGGRTPFQALNEWKPPPGQRTGRGLFTL